MSEPPWGLPDPNARLTRVPRGGLTDAVIDQLRQRIAEGVWGLHERLPIEAALAQELGVGRSTIREAVRVLVHAGLLEVRQGNGTFVRSRREIDAALQRRSRSADLLEAFKVRRALEIEVAREAAQNRTEAQLVQLRELAKRREEAYARSWDAYRTANVALREHLLEMTGNALLSDLYRGVATPFREAAAKLFDDAELTRDDPHQPETRDLIQAIEEGDASAAITVAERHMDNAIRVLTLLLQAAIIKP